VQLITTDAVSVYQWPDEATAARFAGGRFEANQVDHFVLSYAGTEQRATPEDTRTRFEASLRELLGYPTTPGTG
jgi:hypothetical protein